MKNGNSTTLADVVLSLSAALDLISPAVVNHHRRVSHLASLIALEAGLSPRQQHDIALAGLLHDAGAFSLKERIDTLTFEINAPHDHAERGYLLLKTFAPLTTVAGMVRHHHVPWDNGNGQAFQGEPVSTASNILHLADRIAVLVNDTQPILNQVDGIMAVIRQHNSSLFQPELVDCFMAVARREYLWLELASQALDSFIQSRLGYCRVEIPSESLDELTRLFSRIIDFRSSFTALHSSGVAAVAERIAQLQGFPQEESILLRIAGNLHDLGKLAVPREILEKREQLSTADQNLIRAHSYYTYQALTPLNKLSGVREWASFHHERSDGSGYPFHVTGDEFDIGCRIVAIADIFTALTENRPYRAGMGRNAARHELKEMTVLNKIDKRLMADVSDCYDDLTATCLRAKEQSLSEYLRFRGTFDSWARQARA